MDLGLADRVFVVTGGSRGLGLATAAALVAEGAHVVLSARDEVVLGHAVETLGGSEHAVGLPGDLADTGMAERLVAAAVARYGRLDGALISSGGPPPGTPTGTTDDVWRQAFDVNFLGVIRVMRAAASALTDDRDGLNGTAGSILLMLSSSAKSTVPGITTSNGLRPGLAMLVKDFADELGPRGIRVNGLMPGKLATDRTFALDGRVGAPDAVRRRTEALIPLGRYGEPSELGAVAAFLLSPMASYVTGSLVAIDGGLLRAL